MKKHTLFDYLQAYDVNTIQLLYGEHIINIDTRCKGSAAIVRALNNEKYYFKVFENNHLILDYVGEI